MLHSTPGSPRELGAAGLLRAVGGEGWWASIKVSLPSSNYTKTSAFIQG